MKIWIWVLVVVITVMAGGLIYYAATLNPGSSPASPPSSGNKPTTSSNAHNIDINNFAFFPSSLTVHPGETVTWTNKDSAPHTVISDSGNEISSSSLATGKTYSHTFNTAGTYNYHCSIHPSMKATIIVQ